MKRNTATCLLSLALWTASLPAVQTEEWADEGYRQFAEGEWENVSLHVDGRLRSAPAMPPITDLSEPIVWTMAVAPGGWVALGTGNQGRVLRFDPKSGASDQLFHSGEVMVRALAFDSGGRLYAGTSPGGRVYRVPEAGRPERYFLPEESYVWDMLFDADDNLYIAVGSPARIYRLPADHQPGDEAEEWFSARQQHFTTLAWDSQGALLAGSTPDGILYRIRGRGDAQALYQADAEEIKAIALEESGSVLFSTYAPRSRRERNDRPTTPVGVGEPITIRPANNNANDSNGRPEREEERGHGWVLRLHEDGLIEEVWQPERGGIFSLLPLPGGAFLAGGQLKGQVYKVRRRDDWALIQQAERGGEMSLLIPDTVSDSVLAVTSNPARVYRLEKGPAPLFRYDSRVHDARRASAWGRLHVIASSGAGAITVETRSGNTDRPDETWSKWRPAEATSAGHVPDVPPGRFLQYRLRSEVERSGGNPLESVEVRRVRGFFRAPNEPPAITHIRVFPVGFQLIRQEPDQPSADFDQLLRTADPGRYFAGPRVRRQLRPVSETGHVTAIWRASDPNENRMAYRVYIKAIEADEWRLVADRLDEGFYSFNARGYEDGYYHLRIVASDLPDNDPGTALEAMRLSDVFLIDNAPPTISLLEEREAGGTVTLRIHAEDEHSILRWADYQVNGGERIALRPVTGLFDSREAEFVVTLDDLKAGANTVTFEVVDERGNRSVLSLVVRI